MTKIVSRCCVLSLAAVVCSMLLVSTCLAEAQPQQGTQSSSVEESLRQFLQTLDNNKTTRYVAAFRDLNGDGIPEAIVYLIGKKWCGSGGCNTLILTQDGSSWRVVTKITITRPPIRVLTNTSNGWHSISAWVQGGGIQPGYEAELPFNGKNYPRNPTVPPARRLKEKSAGEVIVSSEQKGLSLYDDQPTAVPRGRGKGGEKGSV